MGTMYRIIQLSFNGTFTCVQYSPFDGTDHCIDWHRKVCSSLSELGDPKRVSATAHQCEYDYASRIISSIQRIQQIPLIHGSSKLRSFRTNMQFSSQTRNIIPVLRKLCNTWGDRMNTEFIQVMSLLISEQPWNKLLNLHQSFRPGRPIPSSVSAFR